MSNPQTLYDKIKEYLAIALLLLPILGFTMTLVGAGIWTLYGKDFVDFLKSEMRIEESMIQPLEDKIDKIARIQNVELNKLKNFTGENRVIYQPAGFSYVRTPVYQNETVEIILTIGRTDRGKDCLFLGGRAIFLDESNFEIPGSEIKPQRQIGIGAERFIVLVEQPKRLPLRPGNVAVYLTLDYNCDDKFIIENTYPMQFILLPKIDADNG